jgi:hypothetical protein
VAEPRCKSLARLDKLFAKLPENAEQLASELHAAVKAEGATVKKQRRIPGPTAVRTVILRYLSGIEQLFNTWEREAVALENGEHGKYVAALFRANKLENELNDLQDTRGLRFDLDCPFETSSTDKPAPGSG